MRWFRSHWTEPAGVAAFVAAFVLLTNSNTSYVNPADDFNVLRGKVCA